MDVIHASLAAGRERAVVGARSISGCLSRRTVSSGLLLMASRMSVYQFHLRVRSPTSILSASQQAGPGHFSSTRHRLRLGSPAHDSGNVGHAENYPDIFDLDQEIDADSATPDLDLRERVADAGGGLVVDMGAYEFPAGPCPWDTDDDGTVGFADLLTVLDDWGPCPSPPAPCDGDVDGNGTVGFTDLLGLLDNWGPCDGPLPISPPQSVQECIDRYGYDAVLLSKCIEAMLLAGTP